MSEFILKINGTDRHVTASPDESLLSVLRDRLDITGPKYGCGEGECAACTVLLDGKPVHSCITPVSAAANANITTVEGLEKDGKLNPVQASVRGGRRVSMRLLHLRHGAASHRIAARNAASDGRPNRHLYEWKYLPLRDVSAHHCGGAASLAVAGEGRWSMKALDPLPEELAQHAIDDKPYWFRLDRRDFLKLFGGGLLVCLTDLPGVAQESGRTFGGHELPTDIAAWLAIAPDSRVTVFTGKVEVGQNIRTSLAQQVAEELRVPFDSITMLMGDTDLVPWDMGTFGSRTTPTMGPQLRKMAAAARQVLVEMAAKRWSADPSSLSAANAKVTEQHSGKSILYGELTHGEKLVQTVSAEVALTPASEWKIAGTAVPKVNGRDFVTGKHKYPSDIVRPEMMFGKVLRPQGFNATLVSLDTSQAEKIPGVTVVHDGDFIAVAAANSPTAERALAALHASWNVPAQPSNQELFASFKKTSKGSDDDDNTGQPSGFVSQALAAAPIRLHQQYTVQYIAHAPLEPRAAVAEWVNGKLTVWTGTQRPFGVRDDLMAAFHLPAEKVRVIQPDMGSGYGGKHTGEAAVEAARLAKAAGKPVKIVWTREEEFTWAYFRPAGLIEISSGADRDGTLVAWEHHNYNSGPAAISHSVQRNPSTQPVSPGRFAVAAGILPRARGHRKQFRP